MDANVEVLTGGEGDGQGQYNGYVAFVGRSPRERIGYLDYSVFEGEIHIKMIEVDPPYRRQGYATLLLKMAKEQFPGAKVHPGYLTDDGAKWWPKVAGLSLENVISVAEEAMERGRLEGRTLHVPVIKGPPWPPPAEHAEVNAYVDRVLKASGHDGGIRVIPRDWDARQSSAQAITDGMNKIGLPGESVNEMTLLHECAHVINRSSEGEGHDAAFARTARDLYAKHLGAEAARVFWDLVGHYVERTAGLNGDLPAGMTIEKVNWPNTVFNDTNQPATCFEAFVPGRKHEIGSIVVAGERRVASNDREPQGMISSLRVHEDFRRKGVASALLAYARAHLPYRVFHSYMLSGDAQGFAQRVAAVDNLVITKRISSDPFIKDTGAQIRLADDITVYEVEVDGRWAGDMILRQRLSDGVHEVWRVHVLDEHQRKGIATRMLQQARADLGRVEHAPEHDRSADGKAWSQRVAGANGDLPNGLRVEQVDDGNIQAVVAYLGEEEVGVLEWWVGDGKPGVITSAFVEPEHRRKGIASFLLQRARKVDRRVHHSETLSPDAKAWSKVVAGKNGDLPEGLEIHEIPGADLDPDVRLVEASMGRRQIGTLTWRHSRSTEGLWPGEIIHVWVTNEMRRKGIATLMLAKAREIDPGVKHSTSLSDSGTAWSQKAAGRNGDLPTGIVLDDFTSTAWGPERYLSARVNGEWIGSINWNFENGVVNSIAVDPQWRRRGVATYLFSQAKEREPRLHHSTDLTGDGISWKRTLVAGKNGDLPAGLTHRLYSGPSSDIRRIEAWLDGKEIGRIEAYPTGAIHWAWVEPEYQRRGVATWMLATMRQTWPDIRHDTNLSDSAKGWSQKVAMPVGPPPSGVRYLATGNYRDFLDRSYVMLGAFLGTEMIGYMTWGLQGRKVQSVWVKTEYRRRRIAETMLILAKQVDPRVEHHLDRTDEGNAWAKAVSPDAPERQNNTGRGEYDKPNGDRLIKDRLLDPGPRATIHDLTPLARDLGKAAGKNGDLPQGLTYEVYRAHNAESESLITAYLDGQEVATLEWYEDEQVIFNVWVHREQRRRGLASEMLRRARKISPDLVHSVVLSGAGGRWADAVA